MQSKLTVVLLLGIVLMLGGCATLEQLVQKPEITFDSLGTRDMSLVEGTLLFRFNVANPNPVGLHLDDILYNLDINGQPFVSSRLNQGVNLVASGSSLLEIPVTVNYLKAFNSLAQFVKADALNYRLSGSAGVGPLRIPYRTSGALDVPKLPDISVENIAIDSLSFSGASLKLSLGMANPNAFVLRMDGLEYAARLGDLDLAQGVARQIAPLTANGRSTMAIDVNLDFMKLGRGAMTLLSGSSGRCQLTGNMLVNTLTGMEKVPFQFDGRVPLLK